MTSHIPYNAPPPDGTQPHVIRPDVICTFEIMDRCNHYFTGNAEAQQACIDGARNAQLGGQQSTPLSQFNQYAYNAGNFTTHHDCTPMPISIS